MKDPKSLTLAYIGGGSRGWAWQLMGDLALEEALCGEVRLYDIDEEAAKCNAVIGMRMGTARGAKSAWRYRACDMLESALAGADFVVISILPGTFKQMESDVHAPEAYGVYQAVGDTTGPGGLMRALRTGPMFQEFARAISDHCPDAWVINYTNPMAQCVRTLYETFPGIKALGCCHEVFGTQKLLCRMIEEDLHLPGVTRKQLRTEVQGVNHFTWITRAQFSGVDLFPAYDRFARRFWESGLEEIGKGNWRNNHFSCSNRVKFDLFLRFGAIAAAGDRHLAEFNPSPRYLKDHETIASWMFALTPVSWRKEDLMVRLEKAGSLYRGDIEPVLSRSDEEGVDIIKALLGLRDMITNVNLPNRGQIANIPPGTVVESNACIWEDHLQPLFIGNMPPLLLSLSMPAITAQQYIAQAVCNRRAQDAFPAFVNDPLLVTLSTSDAQTLYHTMLENTKDYLTGWDLSQ